jgi:hypothetical protein
MKIAFKSLSLLLALTFSLSFVSCKQGTKEKVQDAGEAVVEDTKEAAEKAGEAVKETAEDVKDALVEGTDYHAIGMVPCKMEGQPSGNCDFGVRRIGNGTADVTITRPDGNTVTVHFEMGKVKSVDESQDGFRPEFKSSKEGDLYILDNGEDRYEIPEAVIVGG